MYLDVLQAASHHCNEFDPTPHNAMMLPLPHFNSVSLLLSSTHCHFDVTLRHGSVPLADSNQFDTFLSSFSSISVSGIAPADTFMCSYSSATYFNWICKRTPMALLGLNTLGVPTFKLLEVCHIRLVSQSHSAFAFSFLYTPYIFTVVMTELPHHR